ncbi:MAG: HsdR family type I site-specific deoxyribonuclease [Candidatus Nanoarchaeia archaeon]|nr:HsdR family type I site-specific deoxyribonuclease [Candidatus Nanoarchaeia archaeon]
MTKQAEKHIVQEYMIKKLIEKKWVYVAGKDLDRTLEEPLLLNNLIKSIKRINSDVKLDEIDIKNILNELKLRASGYEGNKQILNFLKNGISIKLDRTKDLVRVNLFDYFKLENNEFIISDEVKYRTANDEKRADIMLYVNGIPLVIIECKDPGNLSVGWQDAYKQIRDYQNIVKELFKYVQIGVAAESVAKYFPIVPWQEKVGIYEWKDKNLINQEFGKDLSMTSIIEMLSRESLLDILKNYLFFREERGEKTKVITRYMQKRAVESIVKRVKDRMNKKADKNKGLIWHWQGSGKTLTMIFAGYKLYHSSELANPTILFVLDRSELEDQLNREFNALELTPKIEPITSIRKLEEVLNHDEGKGKRGFFTVLIHKFREEEQRELIERLNEFSKKNETVMNRKNIVVFIDEGHRTQYGLLAAQMKNIFRNAFFFAFTGTPILEKGKNTYDEFAYPPEENYLDKYFMTDSWDDGFTVRIAYQPRLEQDVHLKKQLLQDFMDIELEEFPEDKKTEIEEKVKKKINAIKMFIKKPERITRIAQDIKEHFKEDIEGRFKAMVVAYDRETCVMYKNELDKVLPKEYSEVVMTFTEEDNKEIKKYLETLRERFPGKDLDEIRKEITTKFNENDNPKILIVTDMLLTGFDAPVLQTMYLDKPLKKHRLLQAIARTNRPYKDVKEAGLIIDYLGILKELKKAYEMYAKEEFKGVLFDKEQLKVDFVSQIKELLELFKGIKMDLKEREEVVKAIERLSDEETAKLFLEKYKSLRKKFELLASDIIKIDYAKDFVWLSYIYTCYLRELHQSDDFEDNEFINKFFYKTLKFIHKSINIEEIRKDLPIIKFDENYIKNLENKFKTKEEKAANILFTLNRFILVDQEKDPIYESLVDRVQRLVDRWKQKTKDYQNIYKEGLDILNTLNEKQKEREKLGLNKFEHSFVIYIEKEIGKNIKKEFINEIKGLSEGLSHEIFSNWENQVTLRKTIEKEIRRFLIKNKQELGLSLEQIDLLSTKILESLQKYEKRG